MSWLWLSVDCVDFEFLVGKAAGMRSEGVKRVRS
jgi:hypothetical protein